MEFLADTCSVYCINLIKEGCGVLRGAPAMPADGMVEWTSIESALVPAQTELAPEGTQADGKWCPVKRRQIEM